MDTFPFSLWEKHSVAPPHPSRRDFTQTNNCSDRRTLVCSNSAADARAGRQGQRERQVDQQANRRVGKTHRGAGGMGPAHPDPSAISRQACVLCESQQGRTVRHTDGPCWHKQMFSGYCCSASLVIVFILGRPLGQGARLCCGQELGGRWGDRVYCQSTMLGRLLHAGWPACF